jgi:hypothetical protein
MGEIDPPYPDENFLFEGCRSAKMTTMGCTKTYCSLLSFFVRGRNRAPYHKKFGKIFVLKKYFA